MTIGATFNGRVGTMGWYHGEPHSPIATTAFPKSADALRQATPPTYGDRNTFYSNGGGTTARFERLFPKGSPRFDTVYEDMPVHATDAHFIRDDEIRRVNLHPRDFDRVIAVEDVRRYAIAEIPYGMTPDGKTVMQQVGWWGWGAACYAMLAMDHGREPNVDFIITNNTSRMSSLRGRLSRLDLKATPARVIKSDSRETAQGIELVIQAFGPGILKVSGETSGYTIILDAISLKENTATIRDPFHGWSIDTTAEAVLSRVDNSDIGCLLVIRTD